MKKVINFDLLFRLKKVIFSNKAIYTHTYIYNIYTSLHQIH